RGRSRRGKRAGFCGQHGHDPSNASRKLRATIRSEGHRWYRRRHDRKWSLSRSSSQENAMRQFVATTLSLIAALCMGTPAADVQAQDFPNRPIRLIVPYPPGGTADVMGRLVAASAEKGLGQSIVVENRGGAGGNIAAEIVARSP